MSRYQADGYHGSASHGTLLRNQLHGLTLDYEDERRIADLCRGSYYYNVIGNIIGDASWTPTYYDAPGISGVPSHTQSALYILGYPNMGNTSLTPATAWSTHPCEDGGASYPAPHVASTMLRHGNYDYYNSAVMWDEDISDRAIPHSLFYGSKPSFFGDEAWPPIGSDVPGHVTNIPAKTRWDAYEISGDLDDLF